MVRFSNYNYSFFSFWSSFCIVSASQMAVGDAASDVVPGATRGLGIPLPLLFLRSTNLPVSRSRHRSHSPVPPHQPPSVRLPSCRLFTRMHVVPWLSCAKDQRLGLLGTHHPTSHFPSHSSASLRSRCVYGPYVRLATPLVFLPVWHLIFPRVPVRVRVHDVSTSASPRHLVFWQSEMLQGMEKTSFKVWLESFAL